jgi:hypothetical protein
VNGPRALDHGWYARSFDGCVAEVWIFGAHGQWVAVSADGPIVLSGGGDYRPEYIARTKAEAIERVLEAADEELSRAGAAVDRLRVELASA